MAAKKVKVILDEETGAFSVDQTGFQGQGCGDVAKMFEDLGGVTKSVKKPEWKQKTVTTVCK